MNDISIYFEPVDPREDGGSDEIHPAQLFHAVTFHNKKGSFPSLEGIEIAIIGINEDRYSVNNHGCAAAPDEVRKYLYKLYKPQAGVKIADLGNIRRGNRVEDTCFAVREALSALLSANIIPVMIGGSHDLTYAAYLAYESLGKIINIVTIDPAFDLGNNESLLNSRTFLNKIITHQPSYLFNYTNIGYQTYYVDPNAVELMKKLYFDVYRLGLVQADIEEVEPMVRNADLLSVDIGCVRQSDAPGNRNAGPNGFYGEELCRIMRYAGLSDKLTCIGIFEVNPQADPGGQTAHLSAQAIWYFIDGYLNRKQDFPIRDKKDYVKYRVMIKDLKNEIVFFKSKKSDRWWMEVPCSTKLRAKYERHYLVPCSYQDYSTAMKEEIPDRWWQAFQKLM